MSGTADKERGRLFAPDEQLRAEGNYILDKSGVGSIIIEAGFYYVGSYVMKTMIWQDLDFE